MRISAWGLLICLSSSATALGHEPPPPPVAEPLEVTGALDARWLKDLGSDDFGVREDATRRLYAAGASAVDPICVAIIDLDREAATRAVSVLDKLSQSSNPSVQSAATAGLKSLERSNNLDVAVLARAARLKWDPLPQADPSPRQMRMMARAGLQFQVGGNGELLNGQIVNGERTITLQQPGKRTVIQDVNGTNIRITMTETVNGEAKVQQFIAENEQDLARKHPEAARIYKALHSKLEGGKKAALGAGEPLRKNRERMEAGMAAQKDLIAKMKRVAMLRANGEATEEAQKEVDEARDALRAILLPQPMRPR